MKSIWKINLESERDERNVVLFKEGKKVQKLSLKETKEIYPKKKKEKK